jgi:hypothetical protein
MAQIQTETLVITFSRLIKDNAQPTDEIVNVDIIDSLNAVAEELAGAGVIVEIQQA